MNTEQIVEISWETCMAKPGVSSPLATPFNPPLQPMYLLDYPVLFHKQVMLHHSKHLYASGIPSPHLTLQMRTPF